VPTLALNYGDEGLPAPANLYQFGLAPEDEIRQTVKLARQAGHQVAAVLTPSGNDYLRIRDTFASEWKKLGGEVVAVSEFGGNSSYSDTIRLMLDVDDSEARAAQLRSIIPRSNIVFTPRRRQDVDVLFLLANPAEGRQIRPTMGFHFAGDVAVYALPAIYDGLGYDGGTSTNVNRDLSGINFIDAPWVLTNDDPLKPATASAFEPGAGPVERLRAMGVDTYRLHNRLAQLANFPGVSVQGATGNLSMRSDGSIQRELLPAQFVEGTIVLPGLTTGGTSPD
jgi:outer membrane PBP1 activator LpoA protein